MAEEIVAGSWAELTQLLFAFLDPPSLDARIVNQAALFSVMSSARARLFDWPEGQPAMYRRIVIPAGLKWEVRDKLDQGNITERVLFPGLDGLSGCGGTTRNGRATPADAQSRRRRGPGRA